MRAEMNVHPAKKTSMVIETASPAAFEKGGAYLARFAFATDVTVTAKYEGSTDGMVNVATPDAKGFIPMMELIDRDKELARLNGEDAAAADAARKVLVYVLDKALKLLHPFMPFITEEIYQALPGSAETIMNEKWPGDENMKVWAEDCADFEKLMDSSRLSALCVPR